MNINELFRPRYGLSHDPNWTKYHQWAWDYFPIILPACTVHRHQADLNRGDIGVVNWKIEKGVPIVSRFDDSDGGVLVEILPELPVENEENVPAAASIYVSRTDSFGIDVLSGMLGIGFEWVFDIPIKRVGTLQPWHPLGVVRVDGAELIGKETSITINAGGRVKGHDEFLAQEKRKMSAT